MSEAKSGFRDPKVLIPFIIITLIWGSTWIVIKDQLGTVPAPWSVSYRYVIAPSHARRRLADGREPSPPAPGTARSGLGIPQFC